MQSPVEVIGNGSFRGMIPDRVYPYFGRKIGCCPSLKLHDGGGKKEKLAKCIMEAIHQNGLGGERAINQSSLLETR